MRIDLHTRESGSGPPLVLLHAFPLSSAMWLAQREALSSSFRVITPDLRGFGGSPLGHDEPSLDAMADDVAGLLDRLDLDRVTLGGLSMGGYVTMAFLRRHSDRVGAVVLADTKAGADPPEAAQRRESIAQDVLANDDSTALIDQVLPTLLGATSVAKRAMVAGRVKALVQAAPAPAVAWAQRAMAARPDSSDTLAAVGVPTLVIVGEEDVLSPPVDAEHMVSLLSDVELVRIPAAGHLSAVEAPEEFTAAVEGFLPRARDTAGQG